MKLELDYIRQILERIEEETDGISEHELRVSENSSIEIKGEYYHFRRLLAHGELTIDQAVTIVAGTKRLSGDTLADVEATAAEAAADRNRRGDDPDCETDVELLVQQTRSSIEIKGEYYHFRRLLDVGFVDGRIVDFSSQSGRAEGIYFKGLTMQGHQALEAMRDDKIWNSLKSRVISAGVEGLQRIPGLAIELLLRGAVG